MTESDPAGPEPARTEQVAPAPRTQAPDEPTVGTGSVVAITCIAAAIFITVIGVLILLFVLGRFGGA